MGSKDQALPAFSIPIIANNPTGCNYGQVPPTLPLTTPPPITCDGGVIVINPLTLSKPSAVIGAFDATTNTGVIPLSKCGPNGASVGPDDNVLLGCTPQNNPSDVITFAINATTKAQTPIANITGSDEVWYNSGDGRYYTGSSWDCTVPGSPCPTAAKQTPVLGVIDAEANTLIEKVPQSSGSHSVAGGFRAQSVSSSPRWPRLRSLVVAAIRRPWARECAEPITDASRSISTTSLVTMAMTITITITIMKPTRAIDLRNQKSAGAANSFTVMSAVTR